MKKIFFLAGIAALALAIGCNKEERLMKRLEGNWSIESSVKTIHHSDGSSQTIENVSSAGKLVISEGSSDNEKQYDFFYVGSAQDTMKSQNILVTDEYNNRMVMVNAYLDTAGAGKNVVWTIVKEKKNKQIWTTYGVDSTLFYPSNNQNPGAAANWVTWEITLKRD